MNSDTQKASAVLREFMSVMRDWENKFATLYKRENGGPEAHSGQAKNELQPIYEKYLTRKERRFGRMAGPSAGYPPDFDPDAEKIVAVEAPNNNKVVIETLWTHPKAPTSTRKYRYIMVHRDGEWRLDRREAEGLSEGKWLNEVL